MAPLSISNMKNNDWIPNKSSISPMKTIQRRRLNLLIIDLLGNTSYTSLFMGLGSLCGNSTFVSPLVNRYSESTVKNIIPETPEKER